VTTRRATHALLLLALLGCQTPRDRVDRGEALLAQGAYEEARQAFVDALRDPTIAGRDRSRAELGEARAYFEKGELEPAVRRAERVADDVSDKHYLLGEIAVARGDMDRAEAALRRALALTHGGDTHLRLAWVIGHEARDPAAFARAAEVLEAEGAPGLAAALREAEAVWRELLAGGPPAELLVRLEAVEGRLADYPAARVLKARLLDAVGRTVEADDAWRLPEDATSAAFRAWAEELRAELALAGESDEDALTRALAAADPASAARFRERLAGARALRGDLEGALELLEATIAAGPPHARRALPRAASVAELLGLPRAGELWAACYEDPPEDARGRLLRAAHMARSGDLLGAAALLSADEPPTELGTAPAERWARLRAAARLLEDALAALAAGTESDARRLARGVAVLAPGDPAAAALRAAAEAAAPRDRAAALRGAAGRTQRALDQAAVDLLLRAVDLAAAGERLAARAEGGLDASAEAPRAVARALAAGRAEGAAAFLREHRGACDARALDLLRSDDRFAGLSEEALGAPHHGLAGLAHEVVGRVASPPVGFGLARVRLAGPWSGGGALRLPDGTRLAPDAEAVARRLGCPLGEARLLADVGPEVDAEAWDALEEGVRSARLPASSVLEID